MSRDRSRPERRFWKPDVSKDVEDELTVHLELRQTDLVERGHDPVEAREIAARRFGDVQSIAATCRDIDERWYREQRRASMWMDLRQDVTYGLRMLRKAPGFVLAAVVSLSIGIAATTAVFSMINALLLRTLPGVTDSSRLASIYTVAPRIPTGSATDEDVYRRYREVLTSFSGIAGFARTSVAVGLGGEPFAASAVLVTDTYFDVLGTQPSAGRLIDASVTGPRATRLETRSASHAPALRTLIGIRSPHSEQGPKHCGLPASIYPASDYSSS
jgi:hypothetical protein